MKLVMGKDGSPTVLLPGDVLRIDLVQGTLMIFRGGEFDTNGQNHNGDIIMFLDHKMRETNYHFALSGMRPEDRDSFLRPMIHLIASTHGMRAAQMPVKTPKTLLFHLFDSEPN